MLVVFKTPRNRKNLKQRVRIVSVIELKGATEYKTKSKW